MNMESMIEHAAASVMVILYHPLPMPLLVEEVSVDVTVPAGSQLNV